LLQLHPLHLEGRGRLAFQIDEIFLSIKQPSNSGNLEGVKHMKKCSFALNTLLLALFVIAFGIANQVSAYERGNPETVQGTISSVDSDHGQFVIKTAEGEQTLKVSSSTKISKGGTEIKLADIKAGDKVRVEVEEGSAKTIAVEEE
jgi:hypothetical protein